MRQSMKFCQGSPGSTDRKQPCQRFFVMNLFNSLQRGPIVYQWFYLRNNYTFKRFQSGTPFSRGFQLFRGGGGGVKMIISIETHITCEFQRGGGGGAGHPILPLDMRMNENFCMAIGVP